MSASSEQPIPLPIAGLSGSSLPKWESANLDLLRTVAVLLVLAAHLMQFFRLTHPGGPLHQFGAWGVRLFFVHTSVVLMLSLERQRKLRYDRPYLVFILRRCFRLFPLSLIVVSVVCAFRWPVGDLKNAQFVAASFDLKTVVSNLLLIQNLTHVDSVMATLWTLPYEMQMYLVLPLLFVVADRFEGVLPVLAVWLVCAAVARVCLSHPYLDVTTYVPCFVAGVVGYKLLRKRPGNLPFAGWPVVLFVTTAVFQRMYGVKSGWLCCLLVGVTLSQFREMPSGRLQGFCQIVARYSYGIYLTHFVCIWFAFVELDTLPLSARWIVFVLCAAAAPAVLYHAVEAPMISLGGRVVRRFRADRRACSTTA